jgi:hypothetical protein
MDNIPPALAPPPIPKKTTIFFSHWGVPLFSPLQPRRRGPRKGCYPQRHGPHWRASFHQRGQRGLHHDTRRRLVRPDGERRRAGDVAVWAQSLLAAAAGAARTLERSGGGRPGPPSQGGGAGPGAGPVREYPTLSRP